MTRLLYTSLIAMFIFVSYSEIAYSVCIGPINDVVSCIDDPPNPDPDGVQEGGNGNNLTVNVLENAAIDTVNGNGLDCIKTGPGNDDISITGASLDCQQDSVNGDDGINTINIVNSTLISRSDVIDAFNGTYIVTVDNSNLLCTGNNNGCDGMNLSNGDDEITITESIVSGNGFSFRLNNGDNVLRLGTGADIRGVILCSSEGQIGNNSLVFQMSVPTTQLAQLTAELESKNPDGDSIVINGLFYEWENCDQLVANLSGGFSTPVPTLSEWALIAMAGILGVVGFMVIRRRAVPAQ